MKRRKEDDLWRPGDYDDEPRLPSKSALDLLIESCRAADAERERQQQTGNGNTEDFDTKELAVLGACPSNAKSAALAPSSWGPRNYKAQDMATRLITRTGS